MNYINNDDNEVINTTLALLYQFPYYENIHHLLEAIGVNVSKLEVELDYKIAAINQAIWQYHFERNAFVIGEEEVICN